MCEGYTGLFRLGLPKREIREAADFVRGEWRQIPLHEKGFAPYIFPVLSDSDGDFASRQAGGHVSSDCKIFCLVCKRDTVSDACEIRFPFCEREESCKLSVGVSQYRRKFRPFFADGGLVACALLRYEKEEKLSFDHLLHRSLR